MTQFITEHPFPAVQRHKNDAKKYARENEIAHSKALDDLTNSRFSVSPLSKSWHEFQRFNTAKVEAGGLVITRLANDLPLEIQLLGFNEELSDFTGDVALTRMKITASAAKDDRSDFRIVCKVGKASDIDSAHHQLPKLFDSVKNDAPLRERLGPVVESLKLNTLEMLTRWETWTPQAVRLSPDSDNLIAIQEAELLISEVLKLHGPKEAVWASKAVLADFPTVPAAWLTLLKFRAKYPKKEYVRIIDCGLAACDFAYGDNFSVPQAGDPGLVLAIDTFIELGQFAAAYHDATDNTDLAEINLERNLKAVVARGFPATIMRQSQTLKPVIVKV